MSDLTLSTIIVIVQDLTYSIVFLLCIGAAYMTLKQPSVKRWLADASLLVNVVFLLALTTLLYQAISPVISDFLAFPQGLINSGSRTAGFTASARCLGGVLILIGLVVGSWMLGKERSDSDDLQ